MKKYLILLLCCMMVSGCSGLKNIQDVAYVIGIGVDYDQDHKEYIIYLQGLSFTNVAKLEGQSFTQLVPVYIGSARGETLNLAVRKLYKLSNPPLFFGHLRTIVLTERVSNNKIKQFLEEVGRNRSVRGTMRVFMTNEKIEDVFKIHGLFNYPPLYTILYKESKEKLFKDEIRPVSLMQFLRKYYEPMGAAKLPLLKIDQDAWKAGKKYPSIFIDGYSVFQSEENKGTITKEDALLIDWILEKRNSLTLQLKEDDELIAVVDLGHPKLKVTYKKGTDYPIFTMQLSVQGELVEKRKHIPYDELASKIKQKISNKVNKVYEKGRNRGIDSFDIGEKWYRKHPKEYHDLQKNPSFYLHENSLQKLKVEVEINNFNSYRYNTKNK
ncbi:Ger(x)C family spore germination protein [Bacillus sp. 165]|uniref:Ger(x)C family spore germination protein n=1 Tax=Bacillus sp. 165 TaxID=1529117 RepID=UPI001AD9F7EE|nr:Ger(x)C family spore germination protein [Bacillus sp. 165]MBO9129020.1 Ger(x)C family spore germination protein [Bacillus sp. 165]